MAPISKHLEDIQELFAIATNMFQRWLNVNKHSLLSQTYHSTFTGNPRKKKTKTTGRTKENPKKTSGYRGILDLNRGILDLNRGILDLNRGILDLNRGILDLNIGSL